MGLKVRGIEKMSLVDFDEKISITLFFGGCNMKCPFCHNSSLVFDDSNTEYSLEEIEEILKERVNKIDAVVITGGEPTLDGDALIGLIKVIRKYPYLIKLDTNGTTPELLKFLVSNKFIDYVAMDIKNSFARYNETIGVKNFPLLNKVKETITYLLENHVDYEFRTTIVKEFHTLKDIEALAKEIEGAKRYRLQKFISSPTCINPNLHEVSDEEALEMKKIASKYIEDVELRSY